MIDSKKIVNCLHRKLDVFTYNEIDSTNDQARRYLKNAVCERAVFIAGSQTTGKGRLGRSFYSPPNTGIYMTYIFRINSFDRDTLRITTAASVAVAKALDCGAKIKWVNDLYLNGKKICGILTETISAKYTYVLIGIGVNLTTKVFPDELSEKAGSVGLPLDIEHTIAAICDNLSEMADDISSVEYLEYYRNNMLGIGKSAVYIENGQTHTAVIEGISEWGELIVTRNNEKALLCSGEITIQPFFTDV